MIIIRKYDHNKKIVEQGAVNRGGLKDQLYIGLALVPFKLGFNAFSKILSHSEAGDYVHKLFSQSSGIHKRLDFVCTHPEFQGLGLYSELMNRVIEDADKEKFTLYLSSSDVKNQEYYRRFGFNWVGECEGEAGFVTAGMVRKPNGDNKALQLLGRLS
ncbi:hypothetical protein TL16_g12486 [Triparma laevis f. inornata]|uniref:N-acetyltransferase domain-containing protein n=2 Tax=Triparma laevis TaxID=1534972 RepID=A0A9W7FQN3_9STRA|nr:hypothetical protein TL16_g12486 [Triparma laevis f. inornata]GMI16315.1 hypothetical protein TrLO_g11832 [Triparma laevis f. longispina]